jgi:hypothetical protein
MASSLLSPVHDILLGLEASFIYDQVETMVKIYRNFGMTFFCHNFGKDIAELLAHSMLGHE